MFEEMQSVLWWSLGVYLFLINIIAYVMYGMDKQRAKRRKWRISERKLLLVTAVGGSLGAWLGMRNFRHKTKHWKFRIMVPLCLCLHVMLIGYLCMGK